MVAHADDLSGRPLLRPLMEFQDWVRQGKCLIENRDVEGRHEPLILNTVQKRTLCVMMDQAYRGEPIRVITPKARKMGVSTLAQAVIYFLCHRIPNRNALTYAQTKLDTEVIFEIPRRMHGHRGGLDDSKLKIPFNHNGSTYLARTMGSKGTGRGGTPHYLHVSELAACQSESGLDSKALCGLINSVPDRPHTIVFIESTGDGPFGEFYDRVEKARKHEDEYQLIFNPWWMDDGYTRPAKRDMKLNNAEAMLQRQFGLTNGQFTWARMKMRSQSSPQDYMREFPTVLGDCFCTKAGRVYPTFSAAMLEDGGHVGRVKIDDGTMVRYRTLDWGASTEHPMVALWVAHDPLARPGIVVDPSCEATIREFLAYVRDLKSGRPIKRHDHTMDALRILLASLGERGFFYVYRELYLPDPPSPDAVARQIHDMSGWEFPDGANLAEIDQYVCGPNGERFERQIADRSRPDSIKQFSIWGIQLEPHTRPTTSTEPGAGNRKDTEIEDGIAIVNTVISAESRFLPTVKDPVADIYNEIALMPRRPIAMSRKQREQIREDLKERDGEFAFAPDEDDDDYIGSYS